MTKKVILTTSAASFDGPSQLPNNGSHSDAFTTALSRKNTRRTQPALQNAAYESQCRVYCTNTTSVTSNSPLLRHRFPTPKSWFFSEKDSHQVEKPQLNTTKRQSFNTNSILLASLTFSDLKPSSTPFEVFRISLHESIF